jgi:hypothetical protein
VDRERDAGSGSPPAVEVRDLVKRYRKGKGNAVGGMASVSGVDVGFDPVRTRRLVAAVP